MRAEQASNDLKMKLVTKEEEVKQVKTKAERKSNKMNKKLTTTQEKLKETEKENNLLKRKVSSTIFLPFKTLNKCSAAK